MTTYALTIWQPTTGTPDPGTLAEMGKRLAELVDEVKARGQWVFNGGLHSPETYTVVRPDGLVTDGPYVEGKEFVGGYLIVDVPDLDVALEHSRRFAGITGLPIEVRPFQG